MFQSLVRSDQGAPQDVQLSPTQRALAFMSPGAMRQQRGQQAIATAVLCMAPRTAPPVPHSPHTAAFMLVTCLSRHVAGHPQIEPLSPAGLNR